MRKKFTMLFVALLACVGVVKADVEIQAEAKSSATWTTDIWTVLENVPTDVTGVEKAKYADATTNIKGFSQTLKAPAGLLTVTFKYKNGNNRLDILGVDILNANQEVVAYDYHFGFSGGSKVNNKYSIQIPADGEYTMRYWVTFCAEENTSNGDIAFAHFGNPQTLSVNKVYRLKNTGLKDGTTTAPSTYLYMLASATSSENVTLAALDESANGQLFVLEEAQNGQYLLKSMNGNYVNVSGWNAQSSSSGAPMTIEQVASGVFTLHQTVSQFTGCYGADDYAEGKKVYCNKASTNYIQWAFEEVYTLVEVVYNFTYGGETKYTQKTKVIPGEDFPEIENSLLPIGLVATKPAGKVAEANATQNIALSVDESQLPFVPAKDYESIEHWYYMNIRDDGPTYMYYTDTLNYIKADASSDDKNGKDEYTWAFIGNPIDGFSIVNRAAGASMILSAPVAPTENKKPEQLARMVAKKGATGNLVWTIMQPTHKNPAAGTFYVQHPTAVNYAFNRQDYEKVKTLCYWSSRDTGSALQVVERPIGPEAELAALVKEIEAMGIEGGANIGNYTESSVNALNAAIAAAKAITAATDADVAALQAALDGLRLVLPDPAKYYIFDCAYENRKLRIGDDNKLYWEANGYDTSNSRAVFQFEIGSKPNTVKIKSVHTQSYLGEIKEDLAFGETGAEITVAQHNKEGVVVFTTDGETGIHANTTPVRAYTNKAGSNRYKLVEVTEFKHTLAIDEYDYMTLMLGYNVEVPEGVTAYKVTGVEDNELKLTSVGTVIPANEPVVVYANVAAEETKNVEFAYTAVKASKSNDNLLKGSLVDATMSPTANFTAYVMGLNANDEVVMGKAKLNDAGKFKIRANKAYLEIANETAAGAAMFSFGRGEETTSIENSEITNQNSEMIYDLLGRRVEKMEKGIYIVNGKKVIVK